MGDAACMVDAEYSTGIMSANLPATKKPYWRSTLDARTTTKHTLKKYHVKV
jgi:hypothetical protein